MIKNAYIDNMEGCYEKCCQEGDLQKTINTVLLFDFLSMFL